MRTQLTIDQYGLREALERRHGRTLPDSPQGKNTPINGVPYWKIAEEMARLRNRHVAKALTKAAEKGCAYSEEQGKIFKRAMSYLLEDMLAVIRNPVQACGHNERGKA